MRWTRQQYLDLMTFRGCQRPMFSELFGPLVGLDAEWRAQGASEDEIDMVGFDWDYVRKINCGGHCGPIQSPPVTIEETDEQIIQRDYLGRTVMRVKNTSTIALPMDHPVTDMDSWQKVKPLFEFHPQRIDPAAVAQARAAEDTLVRADIPGAFDMLRELMGVENACMAYYDQPELVRDILSTMQETSLRVLDEVSKQVRIDQLGVHEDFAGRNGPLIGPDLVRSTFKPYYRAAWDLLRPRGTQLFNLDTDGNIYPVLDELLDCGINVVHPMEPAAGMDIVAVRQKYGKKLAMQGGIDKFALLRGREAIRAELAYKMQPLMRDGGGIVFGLDHRIPNGTKLAEYRYYIDEGRRVLGLPPRDPAKRGWARMAG